jgi:hypothetical protein
LSRFEKNNPWSGFFYKGADIFFPGPKIIPGVKNKSGHKKKVPGGKNKFPALIILPGPLHASTPDRGDSTGQAIGIKASRRYEFFVNKPEKQPVCDSG